MPKLEKEITIKNEQGLHARPAALFVQIASKYDASVTVRCGGETVNGKSIMSILTLGAQKDAVITVEVDGDQADEVLQELEQLLNQEQ